MLIKNIKTLGNLLLLLAFCTISTNAAKANPWENKELQSAAAFPI